jgi:hypothetical protein
MQGRSRIAHPPSLVFAAMASLFHTVATSYFTNNSVFHLFFQHNDSSRFYCQHEKFMVGFEGMSLGHSKCEVVTQKAEQRFELDSFTIDKQSPHLFVTLLDINVTDSLESKKTVILPETKTRATLDYTIDEADETSCIIEQALVRPFEAGKSVYSGVTDLYQRWHCFSPENFNVPAIKASLSVNGGVVVKYLQMLDVKAFFDLVITVTSSSNFSKLEFRTGLLEELPPIPSNDPNKPFPKYYWPKPQHLDTRSLLLAELPDDLASKAGENTTDADRERALRRFKGFNMVSLGTFNFQFRQFLVYEASTTTIYVVTCYNTGSKTSNITYFTEKMPFLMASVQYISNEFILFESPINVTDVNGKVIPTNMNFFVRLPLSQRLDSSMLRGYKNLTRGKYLHEYSSMDRYLKILDFQLPDLDGNPDESLVSSFYYSKSDADFMQFLEESSAKNPKRFYDPQSYNRLTSNTHVFEIYRDFKNQTDTRTYLATWSRTTGAFLGEIVMPTDKQLLTARFIDVENVLVLRFIKNSEEDALPAIFFFSFKRPFLYYRLNFKSTSVLPQFNETSNPDTVLRVECDYDPSRVENVPSSTSKQVIYQVTFRMHDQFNDYFVGTAENLILENVNKTRPTKNFTSDIIYPDGLTLTKEASNFIPGSFMEKYSMFDDRSTVASFYKNPNLRPEFYDVPLKTLNINMPIFFEARKGSKIIKSLVMDLATDTAFYKFRHSKFVHFKNALDNRKVSKVEMIGESDAIFNVSQNIFSLDIEELSEKPLTGIGSFCQSVAYLRPPNLPDIILCLSSNGIEAHYMQERFASQQTNIAINYNRYDQFIKDYFPLRLLYSRDYPSVLLILATPRYREDPSDKAENYFIAIFELYSIKDIFVSYLGIYNLTELNAELKLNLTSPSTKPNKLSVIDIHEGHLVAVTASNIFFVYSIVPYQKEEMWLKIEYLRKFVLQDHFIDYQFKETKDSPPTPPTRLKLNVTEFDKIWIYKQRTTQDSFQTEPQYERRLVFVLEVSMRPAPGEDESQPPSDIHRLVVIFDHRKSSFEAFTTIVSGTECAKLFTGPAFLLEGEKQRRTLALICIGKDIKEPGKDDPPVNVRLAILESCDNLISFSNTTSMDDYETNIMLRRREIKNYSISFFKSKYLLEMEKRRGKDTRDKYLRMIRLRFNFTYTFVNTYKTFMTNPSLDNSLTSVTMKDQTVHLDEILGHVHKNIRKQKIKDYFNGHVFKTRLTCESNIECRDDIVNGTFQEVYAGDLASWPQYQKDEDSYYLDHLWFNMSYNPEFEMSYIMTKSALNYSYSGANETIQLGKLGQNCSQFTSYSFYLIAICSYNNELNFFRIYNIMESMAYFDIPMYLPNKKVIYPQSTRISIRDEYLAVFTYSSFFNRYLTAYLFKFVPEVNRYRKSGSSRFFFNPLQTNFGIWFLVESPMNDENVELMVYKEKVEGKDQLVERVYFWSNKRKTPNSLSIRAVGYQLSENPQNAEQNSTNFVSKATNVCDEKGLTITFNLDIDSGASYLLNFARVLPLDHFTTEYFDVILNLPAAHDYLVRFNRASLESKTSSPELGITSDALFMCISNPFFGIKPTEALRSEFSQELYLMPANYFPNRGIVRAYFLDPEVKSKAKKLTKAQLFNFNAFEEQVSSTNTTRALLEAEMDTIYSFGLLNYSSLMVSVLMQKQVKQVEYFKEKLTGIIM